MNLAARGTLNASMTTTLCHPGVHRLRQAAFYPFTEHGQIPTHIQICLPDCIGFDE
jgi:hypothetical protein